MKISSRFGAMEIVADDILHFPMGLVGLEYCRQWVLLADQCNEALAWLQSIERPEFSLPVVSPRRFVPGYQMRVARRELSPLGLDDARNARVLVIVGRTSRGMSLNLKAPVVINLERRLGRQVITNGELPVHYELNLPNLSSCASRRDNSQVGHPAGLSIYEGRSHRCSSCPDNAMRAS